MKNNERTKTTMITRTTILMTLALLLGVLAANARAATFMVTSTGDATVGAAGCGDGCSLREAITQANAAADADTINFSSLFNTAQTISLTSGELAIRNSVTITGSGARLLTVRRAADNATEFRIFNITAGTVVISRMTISNGSDLDNGGGGVSNGGAALTLSNVAISGNSGSGGGGFAQDNGTTTILNSTVSGNTAGAGGGILINGGTSNIANTTVSGNTAVGVGAGGIDNSGTLNMNNVTITGNNNTFSLPDNTGGVSTSRETTVNTRNTIISGNTAKGSTSPDVVGDFTSNGNNLIGNTTGSDGFTQPTDKTGVAANLGGLTNNGGQTDTHSPNTGSPAINAGNNCVVNLSCGTNNPPVALTTDQRGTGFPRQSGAAVDIGAFEVQMGTTAATVSISGRVVTADGRGIRNVMIRMTDGAGMVRVAYTTTFGYYRFDDVAAGETYIFTVKGKRFQFAQPTRILNVGEDTTDVNFIAAPQ